MEKLSEIEYRRLPPEVKDRVLREQLIKLAKSAVNNSELEREAFEKSAFAHIGRYTEDEEEQKQYLAFYQQQVRDRQMPVLDYVI